MRKKSKYQQERVTGKILSGGGKFFRQQINRGCAIHRTMREWVSEQGSREKAGDTSTETK